MNNLPQLYFYNVFLREIREVPRNVKKAYSGYVFHRATDDFIKFHNLPSTFDWGVKVRGIYHIIATGMEDAKRQALHRVSFWNGERWEPYG